MKRRRLEVDLEDVLDAAIERTIAEGLNADKEELIYTYSREAFKEMQTDYRTYGTLFSINLKNNLEKEFEKIFRKDKEN